MPQDIRRAFSIARYGGPLLIPSLAVVEREPQLCARIREKCPQIRVEQADIGQFDFSVLGERSTVFGNLPYSFFTEIIIHLPDHSAVINWAVLMLQRELAE